MISADTLRQDSRGRLFNNPYSSWHYRTLPLRAYYMDVDGMEVADVFPVILYEVKTIPRSLTAAIRRGEVTNGVADDLLGRMNDWQVKVIRNLIAFPEGQQAYVIFTDVTAERFMPINIMPHISENGLWDAGEWRICEDDILLSNRLKKEDVGMILLPSDLPRPVTTVGYETLKKIRLANNTWPPNLQKLWWPADIWGAYILAQRRKLLARWELKNLEENRD